MVCEDDKKRFTEICREILTANCGGEGHTGEGIGTLNEKRMHKVLKRFVCEDTECHEIDMGNRYVADVMCDGEIYEIQTGSLYPLKKKLEYYIKTTNCHVTVVHPVPQRKYVIWIDPETGKPRPKTRSPRHPGAVETLAELIYISELIATGRVGVWLLMIEEEEYRYLDGWSRDKKRGSNRYERLPVELLDEVALTSPEDYGEFVPEGLPEEFTAGEFGKQVKTLRGRDVYLALGTLLNVGVLEPGKGRGRAKTYRRVPRSESRHPQKAREL